MKRLGRISLFLRVAGGFWDLEVKIESDDFPVVLTFPFGPNMVQNTFRMTPVYSVSTTYFEKVS